MSEIVSVVSGEAEESDTDEEVSSDGDEGGTTTNGDTTGAGPDSAGGGSNAGLRPSKPPRPRPLRTLSAQPGVIVQGEASETDSDEDTSLKSKRSVSDPVTRHEGLPPLKVEFSSRKEDPPQFPKADQHDKPPSHKEPPSLKYDTLLHRKLRERNAGLQTAVYNAVASVFHASAKELADANQMLGKSQTVIQDVCHNLRVFTTDLKQIEQKLDAVNSCANIPTIRFDQ